MALIGSTVLRAAGPEAESADPPEARGEARERSLEDFNRLAGEWAARHPGSVELHTLATSRRGLPLLCVELHAPSTGAGPDAGGPDVLLLGGLDGRSVIGAEAVIRCLEETLPRLEFLPAGTTLLGIPFAAPDALADVRGGALPTGRNAAPVDEDRDGASGEDGPDDLDGDGHALQMLIEDPRGPWVRAGDDRLLAPAREGDAPRYRLVREGLDDDGDGRFNEDGAGGVDYTRHFPIGWSRDPEAGAGQRPLSEAVARAIADLTVSRGVDVALLFQGTHGGLRWAGAAAGAAETHDRAAVRAMFERHTGRECAPPGGDPAEQLSPGDPLRWLSDAHGVLAFEVAPWGPAVAGVDGRPLPLLALEGDGAAAGDGAGVPVAGQEQRRWARWLDEVQGGMGFCRWHPVDLGAGRVGLVGGFEPRTVINPPPGLVHAALEGMPAFVGELLTALPRLDAELIDIERHGRFVTLEARVVNRGQIGTGALGGIDGGAPRMAVHLGSADARILAGAPTVSFEHLGAGESTETAAWVLEMPPGATLELRAFAPGGVATTHREVRP